MDSISIWEKTRLGISKALYKLLNQNSFSLFEVMCVEVPSGNNARLRYLTMEECNKLLDACLAPHMRAMVTMALHTGMRRGEILNLQWPDLDFASGDILIRDSKNGQARHVPMDSTVRDLLSGYIPTSGSSHVFPSASGGRLSTVQKAFRDARIRAGMPDLHFHDLRHTFASHWVMSGGDLYVLKDKDRGSIQGRSARKTNSQATPNSENYPGEWWTKSTNWLTVVKMKLGRR